MTEKGKERTLAFRASHVAKWLGLFLIVLLAVLAGINRLSPFASGQPGLTSLFVTPFVYVARETGEFFEVAVNISNAGDLRSYSLAISYDTNLLDAVKAVRGGFFPEQASFELTIDESEGFVGVNASLPSSSTGLWGKGTLTCVSFKAAQPPTQNAQHSIIKLDQTQIYDTRLEPIDYCSISGIYFWKSIQPSQLQDERLIDLFTQKGGKGQGASGGAFTPNEIVNLTAYVTYNNWPQQNTLVAFQVIDPSGQTVFVDIIQTDEEGYATVSFRIPNLEESLGLWRVVSSVDVACQIVWDSLGFKVFSALVGGTSQPVEAYAISNHSVPYMVTVIVLTISFIGVGRKVHTSPQQ
ncbi:MAG: cohesin domain-containing protein [Candidatus Bathyarchaeia archaeon]